MMIMMMMMMTMMMCVKKFCARCFCFFEEDEKKKREAFLDACDFSVLMFLSRCSLKKKREAFFLMTTPLFC